MTTSGNNAAAPLGETGFSLDLTSRPLPGDIALIEAGLEVFNERASQPYDRKPLCVFLRDAAGNALGGVTGYTNWGWLYLDCFWLPEEARASGLGSKILAMAEDEARRRGCHAVRLFTYSFQAPDFYAARDYERFAVLDGYPPGHAQIWLRKSLV